MNKKQARIGLTLGLGVALCASVVNAANYTATLKATYANIGVTYNGVNKTLSNEPFTVDGTTYVPLRAVSEIMGASVDWNGSTKMIAITNNNADSTSLQQQLASANYQVTTLQRELETVKAELATYKGSGSNSSSGSSTSGTDITTAQLTATENYLIENFSDYFANIDFDFDVVKKGSRLQLTISYADRTAETAYNKLSQTKIKDMVEEVCDAISERHADINIQGTINYTRSNVEKASFSYDYNKARITTISYGIDEDSIEDIIWNTYTQLNFQAFGKLTIKDIHVSINNNNSTITFALYIDDASATSFNDNWNANISANNSLLRQQFSNIVTAIEAETDYSVNGELYKNSSTSTLLGTYDGDANTLSLYTAK